MTTQWDHDPEAVLDYLFDWKALTNGTGTSDWLASGETISTHTVTVDGGCTVDSDSESGGAVTAWISGGTVGRKAKLECKIVTSGGRTDERTQILNIVER